MSGSKGLSFTFEAILAGFLILSSLLFFFKAPNLGNDSTLGVSERGYDCLRSLDENNELREYAMNNDTNSIENNLQECLAGLNYTVQICRNSCTGEETIQTLEFNITSGGDDGYCYKGIGKQCFFTATYENFGCELSIGDFVSFARFYVTIPRNIYIRNATLTLNAVERSYPPDETNVEIYGKNLPDPDQPTNSSYLINSLTNSYSPWKITEWNDNEWYNTSDIKNIVQELVDKYDYSSGNHMMFTIMGNDFDTYRKARTYEDNPLKAVKLHITYSMPSSSTYNKTLVVSQYFIAGDEDIDPLYVKLNMWLP